ncbi:MAG: carbohydrate-binding family 9-like protein [Kiritimatiellia bacterium]
MMTEYTINKVARLPDFDPADPIWEKAEAGRYEYWHEKSSDHHPETVLRALHDGNDIMLYWQVKDCYVRIAHVATNSMVCEDACVEAFLQPLKIEKGYVNIEINAGGCIHSSHIRNWTRAPGGFADFEYVSKETIRKLTAKGNLPQILDPETTEPTEWWMIVRVPRAYLEHLFGPLGDLSGQHWKGNFCKCADCSSRPHWGTLMPANPELNFHVPEYFGNIGFGR